MAKAKGGARKWARKNAVRVTVLERGITNARAKEEKRRQQLERALEGVAAAEARLRDARILADTADLADVAGGTQATVGTPEPVGRSADGSSANGSTAATGIAAPKGRRQAAAGS